MNMINAINNRIAKIYKTHKYSQTEFSELCGISQATLSLFLKGKCKTLSIIALVNIVIKLNVNANWLLIGEGETYRNTEATTISTSYNQFYEERIESLLNSLDDITKNYAELSKAHNQLLGNNINILKNKCKSSTD